MRKNELDSVERGMSNVEMNSAFAPYAKIFARESWSLHQEPSGSPSGSSSRHRIEEDTGATSSSGVGEGGKGSSWIGGLAMKIAGTQAQPYDRLEVSDNDPSFHAAGPHHAAGGGGGGHGGGRGRGVGARPEGHVTKGDESDDDGAQFSLLRFLQFCGSG